MCDSQYLRTRWPVTVEPLNTFETLELLFPISKKEFILVLFQFSKTIILNFLLHSKIHHSCFLLISIMNRSFMVLWYHCAFSYTAYYLANAEWYLIY